MTSIAEFAAAKLNLYLHVLGKDERDYHLLDSLVAFATIGDELYLTPADRLTLGFDGFFRKEMRTGHSNLVWRAAVVMGEVFKKPPNFAITLTKNLPIASGIGGGSADAAACIRALCRFWDIDVQDPKVMAIALALGADVPVCLASRPAYMGGIGDKLTFIEGEMPETSIVLVNPGVYCPTKDVFAMRRGPYSEEARFYGMPTNTEQLIRFLQNTRNDLTGPAQLIAPAIGAAMDALRDQGALFTRMMGSGATCLGIFNTSRGARSAAREIAEISPFWWVQDGQFL